MINSIYPIPTAPYWGYHALAQAYPKMIVSAHPPASFDRFIEANQQFWSERIGNSPIGTRKGVILVDLLHNNASVLILNLIVARYLAEFLGAHVNGFSAPKFTGHPVPIEQVSKLAQSFGADKISLIEAHTPIAEDWRRLPKRAVERWRQSRIDKLCRPLRNLCGPELRKAVLNLTVGGLKVGDLIYDTYLDVTRQATIEQFDRELAHVIGRAHRICRDGAELFAGNDIRATVLCHPVYLEYGIPLRLSLSRNVPVFGKVGLDPIRVRRYDRPEQAFEFLNTPLDPAVSFFRERLGDRLRQRADEFFPPRQSKSQPLDWFRYGYGVDKHEIRRDELRKMLAIRSDKKICLIMAHQFTDCPHCYPEFLFDDYYQWLDELLKFARNHTEITWLIRQHPYEILIGETQHFNALIDRHLTKQSNIALVPNTVTTSSLFDCVDAVTTVTGTGGIEFASVGVPCILAGKPFYGDLDFTIRPKTTNEYFSMLANIPALGRLSPPQMMRAKEAALVYLRYHRVSSNRVPYIPDLAGRDISASDIDEYWIDATRKASASVEGDPLYTSLEKMVRDGDICMLDQFVT